MKMTTTTTNRREIRLRQHMTQFLLRARATRPLIEIKEFR